MNLRERRNKFGGLFVAIVGMLLVSACNSAGSAAQEIATATSVAPANETAEAPLSTQSDLSGPIELKIWLPPEFSPDRGDLAATILQTQLDNFRVENPNVQIEIRLKQEIGAGGLLDSLEAAQIAAPLALPDIVLLSSDLLPSAIEKNLLTPLDDHLSAPLGEDWYSFGIQSVISDGQIYGIPVAGDALILMHRFSALETAPKTWAESVEEPLSIGFAAADPNSFFSLLHLANGFDSDGSVSQIELGNESKIQELLAYYLDGEAIGVFPFWLAQFDTQEQSWQAFIEGQTAMVVTWSRRFLSSSDSNLGASLLPTKEGSPFTLAKSWSWTLPSAEGSHAEVALGLAEHLSEPEFIAQWTAAAGLLPTRSSSLTAWSPDLRQALASQIVPVAYAMPAPEKRLLVGLPLSEAIVALLKQEISLDTAVQSVMSSLPLP